MSKPKAINIEVIPAKDDGGKTTQPYAILQGLVEHFHRDLAEANIVLAWRYNANPDIDGHLSLGKAKKASEVDAALHGYDFVILLNHQVFTAVDFTKEQMAALIDHELCHCAPAQDDEGSQKVDENGRLLWRIRKHDVEEFQAVVRRHGLWKGDLEVFAKTAMEKMETPLLKQ